MSGQSRLRHDGAGPGGRHAQMLRPHSAKLAAFWRKAGDVDRCAGVGTNGMDLYERSHAATEKLGRNG